MTASDKQLAANRANAQLAAGPATPGGRAVSSMNALRHGLRSTRLLVPGEDAAEFAEFAEGLVAALAPADALESWLVDRIVQSAWRLRRLVGFDAALLRRPIADGQHDRTPSNPALPADYGAGDPWPVPSPRPTKPPLPAPDSSAGAAPPQPAPSAAADPAPVPADHPYPLTHYYHPALALQMDLAARHDPVGKLSRYEAHLQRTLSRDLALLTARRVVRADTA